MIEHEHAPSPSFGKVLLELNDEFNRRLKAGSLSFDPERNAEYIQGVNNNGQAIRVERPSIEVESRPAFQSMSVKIRYLTTITPTNEQKETGSFPEEYNVVLMENGEAHLINDDNLIVGRITGDKSVINDFFDGVYWE